jgi:hypothetical protein
VSPSSKSEEFKLDRKPGKYSVRADFTGTGAQHLNADTQILKAMPFWTGKFLANVAEFQIEK